MNLEEVLPAIREGKKVEYRHSNEKFGNTKWVLIDFKNWYLLELLIEAEFRIIEEPIQVTNEMFEKAHSKFCRHLDEQRISMWHELVRLSKERE